LSLGYLQWNPDVSHLDLRGTVTRPVIFLSYALIALILSALARGLSRALAGLRESVVSLKKRQERLDRLRLAGAMAAGFSHEFSTPLYTLKLRLERIRRASEAEAGPVSLRSDILAASEAIEHCERILRSLTDNGLKARHLSLELLPVGKTVAGWVDEYRSRGDKTPMIFTSRVSAETMLEMPTQPLRQSFFDLIDNACEAREGDGEVEIELREARTETGVEIQLSVLNEGPEFAPVVLEKWGEPFVTTKENGTGLGVFNALTLAQAMGGALTVVREPRRRTRVRMSFNGTRMKRAEDV
jgi:two-component system sensor histidine kinase RegB